MNQVNLGKLFVIATPIGNLEDITLRALRILKEVDFILCEDKRITSRLLNKYEIKTRLISYHRFNENKSLDLILNYLKSSKNVALVSDAGTPLISDPGYNLIRTARESNIKIIVIPGPSALTSALSIFPLRKSEFLFLGFLPHKPSKRKKLLLSFSNRSKVIVLFVAPHDFKKYISEIYEIYPSVNVFYARELTKIFEESWYGNIKNLVNLASEKQVKGEIVLILDFEA